MNKVIMGKQLQYCLTSVSMHTVQRFTLESDELSLHIFRESMKREKKMSTTIFRNKILGGKVVYLEAMEVRKMVQGTTKPFRRADGIRLSQNSEKYF